MEDHAMNPAVPDAGMCGCDREVFERVWRRVMPDGADSPISVNDPDVWPQPEVEMVPMGGGQESTLAVPERRGAAPEQGAMCLGQASAMYAPLLQEMIDGEMEDWRTYQAMARRAAGSAARTLGMMAADERRHAKRLSAACFLITGQRYQPQGQGGSRPVPELMTGLREQFIQEQRGASAYQGAAQETSDSCLRQLYQELAEDEAVHARMIRSLLEQM